MRLYFFNNMYLNGIHNGIQAGHAAIELMLKYAGRLNPDATVEQSKQVKEWAEKHKTFIVLSAGDEDALVELLTLLEEEGNPYPFCYFQEPGLKNALTSVCIVLPERMYSEQANQYATSSRFDGLFSDWEERFLIAKSMCSMAR